MKIRFNAIDIVVVTKHNELRFYEIFSDGLNILRAENSSGKSTVFISMLYALGLEIFLGKKNLQALKPALKNLIKVNGNDEKVVQSFILLELTNDRNELITIKRSIVDPDYPESYKTVRVFFGELLSVRSSERLVNSTTYQLVHNQVKNELGFHKFLYEFIEYEPIALRKYNGDESILYLECLLSLFLIKQNSWSSVQSGLINTYQLSNLKRISFEYILNFDRLHNMILLESLRKEIEIIIRSWVDLGSEAHALMRSLSIESKNYPFKPTVTHVNEDEIDYIVHWDKDYTIDEWKDLKKGVITQSTDEYNSDELVEKMEVLQTNLMLIESRLKEVISERDYLSQDIEEKIRTKNQLLLERERNVDVKKIHNLSGQIDEDFQNNLCPVCHNHFTDSLLHNNFQNIMTLDKNIELLESKIHMIEFLYSGAKNRIEHLNLLINSLQQQFKENTDVIRMMSREVVSCQSQSESRVYSKIKSEIELQNIRDFENRVSEITCSILELQVRYIALLDEMSRLKDADYPDDEKKIQQFQNRLKSYLSTFEYKSTRIEHLELNDDYLPSEKVDNLIYNASASDNVRVIWAYTIALLKTSIDFNANHPGIILFDEPNQHQMKTENSDSLLRLLAAYRGDGQFFVFTSQKVEELSILCKTISDVNLILIPDLLIRP